MADIIIVGHDHNKTIRKIGNRWYINVGSLGCPGKDGNMARAGVLTIENDTIEIESVELPYDVAAVIQKIDELKYPEAENIKKFFYGL